MSVMDAGVRPPSPNGGNRNAISTSIDRVCGVVESAGGAGLLTNLECTRVTVDGAG